MTIEAGRATTNDDRSPSERAVRLARPVLGLLLPVGLALGWELVVRAGYSDGRLVPPPSRIYEEFAELARSGELLRHVVATLLRVAVGFGLGTFAGTLLGAIAGYSGLARRLLDPTLQALRAVPSIAWIPLFILWLGIFETSKVVLIAAGVFFPIYLGLMGAILAVDRKTVEVGRVFRLGAGDGMAYPAARSASGLRDLVAIRARARMDVRDRRGIHGCFEGRLSSNRRPATR
jgi:sulfonate transport system permease protein